MFGLSIPYCTNTARVTAELKWQTESPSENEMRAPNNTDGGPIEGYGLQLMPIVIIAEPSDS